MCSEKRNNGLDVLRILCIFLIVMGHIHSESFLLEGGKKCYQQLGAVPFLVENILGNAERLSINCFVMISAWFLLGKQFSGRKFFSTWLMVFILNVVITIAAVLTGVSPLYSVYVIQAFFPIVGRPQWYMCEYLLLLLTSPFLNKMIALVSRRQHKTMILIGLIFIILIETIVFVPTNYSMPLYSEYIWFVYLYILMAYIKKYTDSIVNRIGVWKWIVMVILNYGLIIALVIGGDYSGIRMIHYAASHFVTDYAALPGVLCSLGLFQSFRIGVKCKLNTPLRVIAKSTGYIYIIHSVPVLWRSESFKIWENIFKIHYWFERGLLIPAMFIMAILVISAGCVIRMLFDKIIYPFVLQRKMVVRVVNKLNALYTE